MPHSEYPLPLRGFKIGADPELFLYDTVKEKYISAEGIIPGTKSKPYPVPGGAVQVDGMAAEFNINPAETFEQFNRSITSVIRALNRMLPKGVTIKNVPAVVFDEDVWESASSTAKELGCSPDFNAWTGMCNPPPACRENPRLRTAAGHLHFGWTNGRAPNDIKHIGHCYDFVQQLDFFLGLWSTRKDPSNVRRALYGKAGACRVKPYGVEYRVLSNFWVLDARLQEQVWTRSCRAMKAMRTSFMPEVIGKETSFRLMQEIIDENNRDYSKIPVAAQSLVY